MVAGGWLVGSSVGRDTISAFRRRRAALSAHRYRCGKNMKGERRVVVGSQTERVKGKGRGRATIAVRPAAPPMAGRQVRTYPPFR